MFTISVVVLVLLANSAFRSSTTTPTDCQTETVFTRTKVKTAYAAEAEAMEPIVFLPEPVLEVMEVPQGHSFKCYAHYNLFRVGSKQWELQQSAHTDEYGFRKIGTSYCVALGTFYGTTIGDKYIITLDNGSKFDVVLCDVKSDRHTDAKNQYSVSNGCLVEFYVDVVALDPEVKKRGNVSALPWFDGCVVSIERLLEDYEWKTLY